MRTVRSNFAFFTAVSLLAVGLGTVGASVPAGAANKSNKTVQVTPQYRRTIVPTDPLNPPATPPAILPTVTCVRKVGARGARLKETVFGYVHQGLYSWDTQPGADPQTPYNYFLDGRTAVADVGQPTQFLPGNRPSRFAVRTKKAATWVVQVPAIGNERQLFQAPPIRTWQVSVKARNSACDPAVPARFVVTRSAGGIAPTPVHVTRQVTFVNGIPVAGAILDYSLQFVVSGNRTTCSAGGVAVAPRVLYGYPQGEFNMAPLAPGEVVRTDAFPGTSDVYDRSAVDTRHVADANQPADVDIIIDTFARCQFGTQVVEAPDPVYGGYSGGAVERAGLSADHFDVVFLFGNPGGGVRFR